MGLRAFYVLCFSSMLQNDGLMYLAVPTGSDLLYWNAANIYGLMRYPMITANWEVVGMFGSPHKDTYQALTTPNHKVGEAWFQPVVVLKNKRNKRCQWSAEGERGSSID